VLWLSTVSTVKIGLGEGRCWGGVVGLIALSIGVGVGKLSVLVGFVDGLS